nr:MAG TPA: hypothetical protein [Caudoviricetes sp.]
MSCRKIHRHQRNNYANVFQTADVRTEKTKCKLEKKLYFHSKGEKLVHSTRTLSRYFLGGRPYAVVGHRAAKPL